MLPNPKPSPLDVTPSKFLLQARDSSPSSYFELNAGVQNTYLTSTPFTMEPRKNSNGPSGELGGDYSHLFDSLSDVAPNESYADMLESSTLPGGFWKATRTASPLDGSNYDQSGQVQGQLVESEAAKHYQPIHPSGTTDYPNLQVLPDTASGSTLGNQGPASYTDQLLNTSHNPTQPTDTTGFVSRANPNIFLGGPSYEDRPSGSSLMAGTSSNDAHKVYPLLYMGVQPNTQLLQMPYWQLPSYPDGQQPIDSNLHTSNTIGNGEQWVNNASRFAASLGNGPILADSFPQQSSLSYPMEYAMPPIGPRSQPQSYFPAAPPGHMGFPQGHTLPQVPIQRQAEARTRDASAIQQVPDVGTLQPTKPKLMPGKEFIRVNETTQGKNLRSARIEAFKPELVYNPLPARPPAWDCFQYTDFGELEAAKAYSVSQIQRYLYNHPLDSRLRIWIQRLPADSARRYPTGSSSRCRFEDCPAVGRKILPGHFRVCFDEQNWQNQNYDPFINAGYVHLFCMERLMDFPQIVRDLNVTPEARHLPNEMGGQNRMSLGNGGVLTTTRKFIEACRLGQHLEFMGSMTNKIRERGLSIQCDGTLNQLLQITKIGEERGVRGQGLGSFEENINRFIEKHHLGDLDKQREGRDDKSKRRRAEKAARLLLLEKAKEEAEKKKKAEEMAERRRRRMMKIRRKRALSEGADPGKA